MLRTRFTQLGFGLYLDQRMKDKSNRRNIIAITLQQNQQQGEKKEEKLRIGCGGERIGENTCFSLNGAKLIADMPILSIQLAK